MLLDETVDAVTAGTAGSLVNTMLREAGALTEEVRPAPPEEADVLAVLEPNNSPPETGASGSAVSAA